MRVIFATPVYDHHPALEYVRSAIATERLMASQGIPCEWFHRAGDPFVSKVRSKLVSDFLKDLDATDLFFLDDDLAWPAEAVLRLLKYDEPVVAGVYPKKMDKEDWPCSLEADETTGQLIEQDGLISAALAPTGFMRVKRWVLEKLWDKAPAFRERELDGIEHHYRAVFNDGPGADGQWWGEDFAFCNLCRQNDIPVWIDPDIPFHHRGQKRYEGKLSKSLDVFRKRARKARRKEAA